jgi:hypothetical protein
MIQSNLTLSHQAYAAGTGEMCSAMEGVFRDALIAESFKIAFDENIEWRGKLYESMPPAVKELLTSDIEEIKPKLIPAVAVVMKKVPDWNTQGLNGMRKAREEIQQQLRGMNDAYLIRCIKMLQG